MIFSIANFKGGVGKTTTCLNVGAGLARAGYKVLLIDTDAQANLTESLGVHLPADYEDYLDNYYTQLRDRGKANPDPRQVRENLFIIPGNLNLAEADSKFSAAGLPYWMMKKLLRNIKNDYRFILIDCPPSMGFLTKNALSCSDYVIIPTLAEYLPTKGIQLFIDSVNRFIIREELNEKIDVAGILITQYNPNPILSRNLADAIQETFPDELFKTRIRRNIAISEAQASGEDIYTYAPDSHGSEDYTALTREIIERYG